MSKPIAEDLKFVGLSEDNEYLIVTSPSGDHFRLRVTPMIRAAVRLDRSAMEAAKAEHEGTLPPREIQSLVRSGMTAQEISEKAHVPIELVQRYEGPVLAERQYVATNAQRVALSVETGAPTLGHIVLDRLAARGVNTLDLAWDAYKSAGHGWIVSVTFDLDNDIRVARWSYKASARSVQAIDEDAKWLSETQISDEPIPRRHLAAVQNAVFDFEAVEPTPATGSFSQLSSSQNETEALLDKLNTLRGTRQTMASISSAPSTSDGDSSPSQVYSLRGDSRSSDVVYDQSANTGQHPVVQVDTPSSKPSTAEFSQAARFAVPSARSSDDAKSATSPSDALYESPEEATISRHSTLRPNETAQVHPGNEQWAPHAPMTSALSALSAAHLAQEPSGAAPDSRDLFGEEVDKKQVNQAAKKGKPKGRSPMPTWDEIMFGSKHEGS